MKYLLDTHAFLWFITDDRNLSISAKSLIEAPYNKIYVSIASLWEMAIKVSLGKLTVPFPFEHYMSQQLRDNQMDLLPMSVAHIGIVATLPFHHRDPFDRLIIAQSLQEDMPIVGVDLAFDAYGIRRIW